MALPCRASYGIFTLYHKAENGSIPCPDAERVQQEDEAEVIFIWGLFAKFAVKKCSRATKVRCIFCSSAV